MRDGAGPGDGRGSAKAKASSKHALLWRSWGAWCQRLGWLAASCFSSSSACIDTADTSRHALLSSSPNQHYPSIASPA
ncbi:hypothetical protein GQ54DRAFT_162149 [Martensiomyces pterosporus]|nr:hypothetical protein GQ54DRAFT_162149 [Martensiomyces pterosporus]